MISVTDHGRGISENDIEKVFDPYFSTKPMGNNKGTGLGLSIAKALVELMGGSLGVDSIEGKGSSFWFTARLQKTDAVPGSIADRSDDTADLQLNAKILLVEDNPINQMVALKMLEKIGLKATLANNGVEALRLLEQQSFDLVLMDIMMPVMNGFEACLVMRGLDPQRLVPIIMLTGLDDVSSVEKAFDAGATDFITKPDLCMTLNDYTHHICDRFILLFIAFVGLVGIRS